MAVEKFIRGKHDDARHDGRYSNVRREQEAEFRLFEHIEGEDGFGLIWRDNFGVLTDEEGLPYDGYVEGFGRRSKIPERVLARPAG